MLRRLRKRSALSQEELAERAGLSVRAISALERGERRRPYPHTVRMLANALSLDDADRTALEVSLAPRGRRHQPPRSPSLLVGREQEIRSVADLLSGGVRLVTLTGPGGVGKTRLALTIGERVAVRYTDGVAFVSLASLAEAELVPAAIAHGLELRASGAHPLEEALHAYLRSRHVLLILDNFEHVLGAAPLVGSLLVAAPRLHALVTSRAPLRLEAEHVAAVPPLAIGPAAELFEQRARRAAAPVAGSDVVTEICRRLDGLPLAIELAAARTRVLPPAALLARLDRPLALLTGGPRDHPQRQQSIGQTIAWSHDLLPPAEQALLQRLAVFAGGWRIDDAAAIAGLDEDEALDLHTGLVDSCLIVLEAGGDQPRFGMLETIRAYAAERLQASGNADDARDRHASHYLELAQRAGRGRPSSLQPDWLDRLELEHDNFQLALHRRLQRGDVEAIAAACFALWAFWWIRGYLPEGRHWTDRALAAGDQLGSAGRAKLLFTGAFMRMPAGHDREAEAMLAEAERIVRRDGNRAMLAWVLAHRGLNGVFRDGADRAAAELELDEAIALSREVGDVDAEARARLARAHLAVQRGRLADADRTLAKCVAEIGDRASPWCVGTLLNVHGRVNVACGEIARAEELLRQSAVILGRLKGRGPMMHALSFLAVAAALRSDATRAALLFGAADRLLERSGAAHQGPYHELVARGRMSARAEIGSAAFGSLHEQGHALNFDQVVALATGEVSATLDQVAGAGRA